MNFSAPAGYYVYAYLRDKDSTTAKAGTPFYIGKGSRYRAWDKEHKFLPPNPSNIIIVEQNLSEIGAIALERFLIRWYGRIDKHTGILRNKTDGGEGLVGASLETRRKMSIAKKGIRLSQTHRQNIAKGQLGRVGGMVGKEHSSKTRQLMKETRIGNWNSSAKLNEVEVSEIRNILRTQPNLKLKELANRFNITSMTISAIKNRRIWKHIP